MTRHLLTLDSLGRDGIRRVLDLAVAGQEAKGHDPRALCRAAGSV